MTGKRSHGGADPTRTFPAWLTVMQQEQEQILSLHAAWPLHRLSPSDGLERPKYVLLEHKGSGGDDKWQR
jgi:hypothetical protein